MAMIKFHGRLVFRQYMPAKSVKYGIKVWMRVDLTGTLTSLKCTPAKFRKAEMLAFMNVKCKTCLVESRIVIILLMLITTFRATNCSSDFLIMGLMPEGLSAQTVRNFQSNTFQRMQCKSSESFVLLHVANSQLSYGSTRNQSMLCKRQITQQW